MQNELFPIDSEKSLGLFVEGRMLYRLCVAMQAVHSLKIWAQLDMIIAANFHVDMSDGTHSGACKTCQGRRLRYMGAAEPKQSLKSDRSFCLAAAKAANVVQLCLCILNLNRNLAWC